MFIHINYADDNYKEAQLKNTKSAKKFECFDEFFQFSPSSIDREFYLQNIEILKKFWGGGYWLWKPYIILEVLKTSKENDIVFYTDSGSEFIDNPMKLMSLVDNYNQDIICFQLPFMEKHYTKRDAFILMECDKEKYFDTKQMLSGYIIVKNTDFSRKFFEEFLNFAKDKRILTDLPNQLGFDNYIGFVDHRHDQSIFSLLCKKHNLMPFRDPSQYGNSFENNYLNSDYNQIIDCSRKRTINIKYWINKFFVRIPRKLKKILA